MFLVVPLLLAAVAVDDREAERGGASPRSFRLGMLAGLVTFLPLLFWVVRPAGVLGWVLLAGAESVFYGLWATVVRWWWRGPIVVAVAPLLWVGMEVWRGAVPLDGFPWGTLEYAHTSGSWLLPMARVVGGHGLSLATALLGVLVFEAGRRIWRATRGEGWSLPERLRAGLPHAQPALVGLAAAAVVVTLIRVGPPAPSDRTLDVLAVQGNSFEGRADSAELDRAIARQQLELTRESTTSDGPADLTVWPESSLDRDPFSARGRDLAPILEEAAAVADGDLLVGANLDGPRPQTFLNTSLLVDASGRERDRYVKRHLVPFGEYVPWRSVLGDFPPLRQVPRDGIPGEGPQAIEVDGVRLATVICFETLFSGLVRDSVVAGDAGLIVATTNDASFGRSAEPRQHLAQSRLRAVETGRWVVHAALSGSSAFVDPDGRPHQTTDLYTATSIRARIPLVEGRTPFLAVGDVAGTLTRWVAAALAALAILAWWRHRRRAGAATGDAGGGEPADRQQ